jgi:hypothetical protein
MDHLCFVFQLKESSTEGMFDEVLYELQHLIDFLGLRDLAVFQLKEELVAELLLDICERSIEPALEQ